MAEPCQQEGAIGRLEATTEQIGKTLERLGSVLEKIAAQGEQIQTLSKDQDVLFERVRGIELNVEREKVKVAGVMSVISVVVSACTAFVTKHLMR